MLEKIMDLHILLYAMAALGGLGAVGMYRRSGDAGNKPYLPKNDQKKYRG